MHYLSICAIHKLETPHLREWIEYHRLVGVDHFYLADNNDAPADAHTVLEPYIAAGIVTSIHIPGHQVQMPVYNRLLAIADTFWAAFIDLDEFLFPIEARRLPEFLAAFDRFGGVVASWFCFGSSGLDARPDSVLKQLHRRAPDDFGANQHIKSIVQTAAVASYDQPHFPRFKDGFHNVNEERERVDGPFQRPSQQRLRINHYVLRSRENYAVKAQRGRPDSGPNPYNAQYWEAFDRNDIFDDAIWRKYGNDLTAALSKSTGPSLAEV